MIKINDREKAEKELEEGKLENVFNLEFCSKNAQILI